MLLKQKKILNIISTIALFFLILNILLKSTKLDYILYIIVTSGVLMAELANTAIEHVANAISGEYNRGDSISKRYWFRYCFNAGICFFYCRGNSFYH